MYEFLEPQIRCLVADQLGVKSEDLVSDVSLRDDLAVDSLDLVELALALERTFAIVMPERILDEVRTYSELVHATGLLIHARRQAEAGAAESPQRIWARIVPPPGDARGTLERTGWLTPYLAETIDEDAVGAGRGARLDVTIAPAAPEAFARTERRFEGLGRRGVLVTARRGDGPAGPAPHCAAEGTVEPRQVAVPRTPLALTDPLLDQLTGAHTTVTVTGYAGDDPWQADDLIACVGESTKRFGDGTPAEQTQALSGHGPCQFVEDGTREAGYHRATTDAHHVHAHFDRRSDRAPSATRDLLEDERTSLQVGFGFAGTGRYYQSGCGTVVGLRGEILTWNDAAYYSQDRDERAFDVGSSTTPLTPTGYPSGSQQGVRAHFDLSSASPNGFRLLRVTLSRAAASGAHALVIHVAARLSGKNVFGEVTLGAAVGPTMNVCVLPSVPAGASIG